MLPTRRPSPAVLAVLGMALLVPFAQPAAGEDDPESERDRVRDEQAQVESELDVLRASEADVAAELDRLAGAVGAAQADLANAEAAVEAADAKIARIDAELADIDARVDQLTAEFQEAAIEGYIGGGTSDPLGGITEEDPNQAAVRQALLDLTQGDASDLIDALHGAEVEREQMLEEAEEARAVAEDARNAAADQLAAVQDAQAAQQSLAADVEARIGDALYEAAALEEQDEALSDEIRERQEELARALPPPPPAPRTPSPVPVPDLPSPPGGIVTVAGIQVAASIAPQIRGLMDRAAADGVPLTGRGYRDIQQQIALRIQNCGPSDYAIWQMPPSQCNPETAIPGQSNHERGLAIDFSWGGSVIESHGHPGFVWLAANAPSFGLVNLPSEPWHWSIDGA